MGNGEKWRATIIKKYGSIEAYNEHVRQVKLDKYGGEAALKEKMRGWQKQSRENYSGNGGFRALNPEQRARVSRKGTQARWKNHEKAN